MRKIGRYLLIAAAVALILPAGGSAVVRPSKPRQNITGVAPAEIAKTYRAQLTSIRARLKAGERISLIVRLKLSYIDAKGNPVPVAELERAKAKVVARLAGRRGIEFARSIPNATALHVIVTSIAGLDRVLRDPMVKEVWEDPTLELLVDESRQIIHATQPWNDDGINTGTSTPTSYTGNGFAIAVLDTGVDSSVLNVQAEACFSTAVPSNYVDALCSPPPVGGNPGPPGSAAPCVGLDNCDHGTHVAGIAVGNSTQLGVAPGAKIVAVQVFTNQQGKLAADGADIIAALIWVYNYNQNLPPGHVKVTSINMSLRSRDKPLCMAGGGILAEISLLKNQGVTVVAASGNDGLWDEIGWPACAQDVVSVGATNKWDVVAPFSNTGPIGTAFEVDLLAPGAGIRAVLPGGTLGFKSGTSMAAPHVAGCVALLAQENSTIASPLSGSTAVTSFETAMKTTGLPVTDWRAYTAPAPPFDYSITSPRLDCGAALWNLVGKDHLATISGKKTDSNGTPVPGWLIEAFSVGEPWPVGYVGHPSYSPPSAVTNTLGEYEIKVPWGLFYVQESPFGPVPPARVPSISTDFWRHTSWPSVSVDVSPNDMGPFQARDFSNQKAATCPAGQDYMVLVANQKDHFAMGLDHATPDPNLQYFFNDRYSPDPPIRMELDENNWSTRAFIHTFDLSSAVPAGEVVTSAAFRIGARPVVQPPTEADGRYLLPYKRLERNDAIWLLFPDINGGILGNPTAWGRGLGLGSIIGPGLLPIDWEYPQQQVRYHFSLPLFPRLPLAGPGLPNYVDGDLRPMINLHRKVGLFVQDDTGVDYAAMHLCTRVPEIMITKTPNQQQFNTGSATTIDLTVTNGNSPIPTPGSTTLQVSDELPAWFTLNPNVSGVYTNWSKDWSCNATVGGPGGTQFTCTYTGPRLQPSASPPTISVPVTAAIAGTHQNCASVDLIDDGNSDILDHNSTCSVIAVGYDIGVRKRKSEYMIKWDNPDTPAIDTDSSVEFDLSVRNFGQELTLLGDGITLSESVPHTGFEYVPGTLISGADWINCNPPATGTWISGRQPQPVGLSCSYTGTSLRQLNVIPPGFEPNPLMGERGFELPRVKFQVRGHETGWWQNCANVALTGHTDEIAANDKWCVNVFVQGNIEVKKSTGHENHEYDYGVPASGQSETIDLTIDVSNLAGKIDAPLEVEIKDQLPVGFSLDPTFNFAAANPSWSCSLTLRLLECQYLNFPVAGASGFPIVGVPLDPIKLDLIASRPGLYENCANGDIKAGITPVDDQPDDISPPDPPRPADTDFDRDNNNGCTLIIVGHDVRLSKSASNPMPNAGESLTFDFQITNHWSSIGPNEQLVLTDVLPAGFSVGTPLPASGPGGWNCGAAANISGGPTITCIFATGSSTYPAQVLPPLSIPVVAPMNAGAYENCADLDVQLENNDEDDVPENNTHQCVTINVPGHLSVTKVSDQTEYNLNDQITFTLTVTNPAPGSPGWGSIIPAGSINFADVLTNLANGLPAGLTLVYANWPSTWGCLPGSWTCTPTVPINTPDAFTFTIVVDASIPGHFNNCFNLTLNGAPNIGPTSDCVDFYVGHDVSVSKSVDNPTPQNGTNVTYTLSVANNLSSVAPPETIVVTDTVQSGLWPDPSTITANNPPWNCTWTIVPTTRAWTVTCTYDTVNYPVPAGSPLPPIVFQAEVTGWGPLNNCATVATDDIPANDGPACVSVQAPESYLAIYKVYDDQTGGTPESSLPSTYTTTGFPIQLSCSSFSGMIPVPIRPGHFSTNDPNLAATPPSGWTSMTSGPSTVPTVPGTSCLISEAALPPIQNVAACQNGSASWETTYNILASIGSTTPTNATVTTVAGQTSMVQVTNTLRCDSPPTGVLTINKIVNDPLNMWSGPKFATAWSCVDSNTLAPTGSDTFVAEAGTPYSATPVTLPSRCTITETLNPFIAGSQYCTWQAPAFSPSNPIAVTSAAQSITITNSYRCVPAADVKVTKALAANSPLTGASPFPIQMQCTDPYTGLQNASLQAGIPPGGYTIIPSLPVGDNCHFDELAFALHPMPTPPAGCTWDAPVITGPSGPLTNGDLALASGLNTVTVTNSYTCQQPVTATDVQMHVPGLSSCPSLGILYTRANLSNTVPFPGALLIHDAYCAANHSGTPSVVSVVYKTCDPSTGYLTYDTTCGP